MGIVARLFGEKTERRSTSLDSLLLSLGLGNTTTAGTSVTPDNALTSTAVWACIRVLSESVAGLPLFTYRRRADGGKERAGDHPLYGLLHDSPNPEQTAFEFREMLAAHVCAWGNGYANIAWGRDGYPEALWPLNPSKMERIERKGGALTYFYRNTDGQVTAMPARDVLHVRGLSGDGTFGYSPIRMHMEAIGLAQATQEFGARFFGNGARPGGVLEHPGKLSNEAMGRLRESFTEAHQGLSNSHRVKIIEEGMTYKEIGVPPEEAQFLETRKFQVTEIARIFRVPPHMIGDLERATFSNIEHQSIDFVVHSLRPWLVRFEQAYMRQLLVPNERRTYFVEHLVDGLLRGDISSRYGAYNTGIVAGFLNRNEVRAWENLNPADGLDTYLVPLNMIESGQDDRMTRGQDEGMTRGQEDRMTGGGGQAAQTVEEREIRARGTAGERRGIAAAQEGVVLDAMTRIVRREVNDIRRAVEKYLVRAKDVAGFLLWLDEFYTEHAGFVDRNLRAGFEAMAALVVGSVEREIGRGVEADAMRAEVDAFVTMLATRWAEGNGAQLRALVREAEEPAEAIGERLDGWEETEPAKNARRETWRAVGAFAYFAYGAGGVPALRWVASGEETCPYCSALDGRVVSYNRAFVGAGDYQPDGAAAPMLIRQQTRHNPLHDGCDCVVLAG